MSEIRDKVIGEIARYFDDATHLKVNFVAIDRVGIGLEFAKNLLSEVSKLAIVDREAELPENPYPKYCASMPEMPSINFILYPNAQLDMLKAGWVKEIKDAP